MKHFEQSQFIIVWYCKDNKNLHCMHTQGNLEDAIDTAIRELYRDYDVCKNRFPNDLMNNTTNYAIVSDSLNRSKYFQNVSIDDTRNITITKNKSL